MENATLQMHAVEKVFHHGKQQVLVFSHVDALFEQGKTYALLGISGTGKSTILQLLAGIDRPVHGKITYNGRNIADFTDIEHQNFLHDAIGLVYQMPYLIDELSVGENVMLKGLMAGKDAKQNHAQVIDLLKEFGLEHKANASPASLSGGEQQRVALARALFAQPKFLLADEPTAHLDSGTKQVVMQRLFGVQKKSHMGIIIATHDHEIAMLCDIRMHIRCGKLEIEG